MDPELHPGEGGGQYGKGGPPQSIRCPISIIVKSPTTQPHFHANQNSHAFQITFILTDFRVPFCWHGDDKQDNCVK